MPDSANKILIVDDNPEIRRLLAKFLAQDGVQMRQEVAKTTDMLPGEDGLSLCRQLRAQSDISVIMLTACGEDVDRVVGLEVGADDYLSKPFNPRELIVM